MVVEDAVQEELPKLTGKQIISLVSLIVYVVLACFSGWNSGLIGCLLVAILLILKCADEKKVFEATPWGTLVLVIGTGVYMSVSMMLGGVDILSGLIRTISTKGTASGVYFLTSGFISWFSTAMAVPIPSLIPTVSSVAGSLGLGMAGEIECVSAIIGGAFLATVSPLSTTGAIMLGCYDVAMKPTIKERNRAFNLQLAVAIIVTVLGALITMTGFNRLFI